MSLFFGSLNFDTVNSYCFCHISSDFTSCCKLPHNSTNRALFVQICPQTHNTDTPFFQRCGCPHTSTRCAKKPSDRYALQAQFLGQKVLKQEQIRQMIHSTHTQTHTTNRSATEYPSVVIPLIHRDISHLSHWVRHRPPNNPWHEGAAAAWRKNNFLFLCFPTEQKYVTRKHKNPS